MTSHDGTVISESPLSLANSSMDNISTGLTNFHPSIGSPNNDLNQLNSGVSAIQWVGNGNLSSTPTKRETVIKTSRDSLDSIMSQTFTIENNTVSMEDCPMSEASLIASHHLYGGYEISPPLSISPDRLKPSEHYHDLYNPSVYSSTNIINPKNSYMSF